MKFSASEKATHVEDSVDPIRDLEIIREELRLKDVATIEKQIEPLKKEVGRDGKAKEKKDMARLEELVEQKDRAHAEHGASYRLMKAVLQARGVELTRGKGAPGIADGGGASGGAGGAKKKKKKKRKAKDEV